VLQLLEQGPAPNCAWCVAVAACWVLVCLQVQRRLLQTQLQAWI